MPSPPRDPLNTCLAVMRPFWLHASCAQSHMSVAPLNLLAKKHRACTLACIINRFRCRVCNKPPYRLTLAEDPHLDNQGRGGASVGWHIDLIRNGMSVRSLMLETDNPPAEFCKGRD